MLGKTLYTANTGTALLFDVVAQTSLMTPSKKLFELACRKLYIKYLLS